jgi:hypothetical protein
MSKRFSNKTSLSSNEEPTLTPDNAESQMGNMLTWYTYNRDSNDARQYFLDYLKKYETGTDLTNISLTDVNISNSIGWLCRIRMGNEKAFPDKYIKNINDAKANVLQLVASKKTALEEVSSTKRPSVQENIQNKFRDILGEIEVKIDEFVASECKSEFNLYDWLNDNQIKAIQAKNIYTHYETTLLVELTDAHTGRCEQMAEAYAFLGKSGLDSYIKFVQQLIESAKKYEHEEKTKAFLHRPPRAKKPKSPAKLVAKLHYLRESGDLKSVDLEKIIGASQLWTYNIKTRVLSGYFCSNNHGLSVKGSTITNYDEEISVGKILRKPDQILPSVISGTKITIKRIFDKINAKGKKLTGRINNDTLLIKVL